MAYLFGQMAGVLRRVENLIIEYRKVKCKPEPNGVRRGQIHQGDVLNTTETQKTPLAWHTRLDSVAHLWYHWEVFDSAHR